MRARELRDVIKVLVLPSLERALRDLTDKRGSRRTARLLVKQALDQLRLSMEPPTAEERLVDAGDNAARSGGIDCDRMPAEAFVRGPFDSVDGLGDDKPPNGRSTPPASGVEPQLEITGEAPRKFPIVSNGSE